MTEPKADLLDGATLTISLGGKNWPVPPLAFKQLKTLQGVFDPLFEKIVVNVSQLADLTQDEFCGLADVTYAALTRAHPTMTREEFDDMALTRHEMATGLVTISQSAYGKWKIPETGEAQGAKNP